MFIKTKLFRDTPKYEQQYMQLEIKDPSVEHNKYILLFSVFQVCICIFYDDEPHVYLHILMMLPFYWQIKEMKENTRPD